MATCLFCRIVGGEIPAEILLDEGGVLAFRDIHPQAPQHVLIIPKSHVGSLSEAGPADWGVLADALRAAQTLARRLDPKGRGFRLVLNNGSDAGQAVAHVHFHWLAGRPLAWPPG